MENQTGVTFQGMWEYMLINETGQYTHGELVAGFCVGQVKQLPTPYMESLLKGLMPYNERVGNDPMYSDRVYLVKRLKEILGESEYLTKLEEVLEDTVQLVTEETIRLNNKRTRKELPVIYALNHLKVLGNIVSLNYPEEEFDSRMRRLGALMDNRIQQEAEDEKDAERKNDALQLRDTLDWERRLTYW